MAAFREHVTRWREALRAWRQRRAERRAERRAWAAIVAKPHDHWLEDAGLSRDESRRILEEQRLHRIAGLASPRSRGL